MRTLLLSLMLLTALHRNGNAQVVPQDPAETTAIQFLERLDRGAWDSAATMVAPSSQGAMSAERLKAIWTPLRAQVGGLQRLEPESLRTADTLRLVELGAYFERAAIRIRVAITPSMRVAGFFVIPGTPGQAAPPPSPPPSYADTSAFREVEITVGEGQWRLPGTLTLPRSGAPFAAVVLVHGSGPNDRDETIGPNKPFRDLAWGLASRGIAVVRYDKRSRAHPESLTAATLTLDTEVVDDVLAALAVARSRSEIDSSRVFVLGHSLGGMLALEIAARDGRLAGAIILAAPARDMIDVVAGQLEYLASIGTEFERERIAAALSEVAALRQPSTPEDSVVLGAPARYWRELARVRPVERARSLDVPLLVLHGERDYQATMDDFALWRDGLAGRPHATVRSYPSSNHLFMPGEGRQTPADLTRPGHVAEEVVEDIARWIATRR